MQKSRIQNMVLSAMFLGIGIVLPLLTGQIKEVGDTLLPMHLPVLLCGFICGSQYGFAVGIMLPFLRSLLFHMPPIYPNAVWMAVELATYGLVVGLMYSKLKNKKLVGTYVSLIVAMITGRIAWGITKWILFGLQGKAWTLSLFIMGGFVDALLGIVIQLILVPTIVGLTKKWRK